MSCYIIWRYPSKIFRIFALKKERRSMLMMLMVTENVRSKLDLWLRRRRRWGCGFMFTQMLGWISLTAHNIPQQTFYETLLLSPPSVTTPSCYFWSFIFSVSFKDGKIISTFLQHSSFNVFWILEVSSRKYEYESQSCQLSRHEKISKLNQNTPD